jgi:hypothetical protein
VRRLPLAAAPGALPLAVGLAVFPLLEARVAPSGVVALGLLALGLYGTALAGLWPGALTWALGLLAAEYVLSLALRRAPPDLAAPIYAAAFFLCAELGWLGLERRTGGGVWLARGFAICLLAVLGMGLGSVLLLAAALPLRGSLVVTALGVAASAAAAACLAWLARSSRRTA